MGDTSPRDIIIVGGGIIGVCSAYYLLSHPGIFGHRVTLVEENAIASAASGKSGGFLALDWHGPSTTSLAALSFRLHKALAAEYDGKRRWGYRVMDSLSFSISARSTGGGLPPGPNPALEQSATDPPSETTEEDVGTAWLNPDGDCSVLGTQETTAQVYDPLTNEGYHAFLTIDQSSSAVH
jgi:hypothetical protein